MAIAICTFGRDVEGSRYGSPEGETECGGASEAGRTAPTAPRLPCLGSSAYRPRANAYVIKPGYCALNACMRDVRMEGVVLGE